MLRVHLGDVGLIFVASRPLALLLPLDIYEDNSRLSFLLSYLLAFAEIAAWQALAILLRHFFHKRKAQKLKDSSF